MRELTNHSNNRRYSPLVLGAVSDPATGDDHHRYEITGFDASNNPAYQDGEELDGIARLTLFFQQGDVGPGEVPNGITPESLLAITGDRLKGLLETGTRASAEHAAALDNINAALAILKKKAGAVVDYHAGTS